jgi:hypothetical protein
VFVSRGLVFTRCHRAQQLEQNRKDGLPEGSRGAQDPPGGLEEAQDFTQRAYTDYHATLQVPSPPSPTPTQRSRVIGGVRMPDVRCPVALLLTAGANCVRVRVRSFSRASARPPTGWPRWRAGREPGSGCVSPPRPTAVLAVEKPRRCVEKPRLPPPRSFPPSLLPSFLPSFLPHARARLVAGCGVDTWSWPTAVLMGLAFQALAITLLIFYYADLWPTTWRPFLVQVGFLNADAVAQHRGGGGGGGGRGGGGGSGRQRKKHQKRG